MKELWNMLRKSLAIMLASSMILTSVDVPVFADDLIFNDEYGETEENALADDTSSDAEDVGAFSAGEEDSVREKLREASDDEKHPNGIFGFAETMITLDEGKEGVVRVVRAGNTQGKASVVFKAVDISAEYSGDYTLSVMGGGVQ